MLAFDKNTGTHVAIKMVPRIFNELQVSLLFNEVIVLSHLQKGGFTSILSFNFFGKVKTHNGGKYKTVYYVMKVEENGELYRFIERTQSFDETISRKLFLDLIEALEDIHKKGICHRDIKTENILVSDDFKLKLCDFGACSSLPNHEIKGEDKISPIKGAVGSPEFNPPELYYAISELDPSCLPKCDIFSLGCALFLIVVNSIPFGSPNLEDPYYKRICKPSTQKFWKIWDKSGDKYSPEFKDLFEKMTKFDPEDRISIEQIKVHPWVTQNDSLSPQQFKAEMRKRLSIVREHYQDKANRQINKIQLNRDEDTKKSRKWTPPASLIDLINSLKLKLDLVRSSFYQDTGDICSSEDSEIFQKSKEIKPKKSLKNREKQDELSEQPSLKKEQSSDSSSEYYFDQEFQQG